MESIKVLLLTLLINCLAASSQAGEIFEMYNGIRQMGMGGASIAVVNDETSILANPAGLGKVRDMFLTLVDPELDFTTNGAGLINSGNLLSITDPQGLLTVLNKNKGKYFYGKAQILPSLVIPNFGIGLLGKVEMAGEVNAAGTEYELNYTNDLGVILAYNFRLLDGRIKLGFNGKFINRVEMKYSGTDVLDPTQTYTKEGLATEGGGISSDVGFIFAMPWAWIPTLAIVGKNVGGATYDLTGGLFYAQANRPQPVAQRIDAAIGLFPIVGKRSRASFTIEYRGILQASTETDHYRRTHVGLEFNFGDLLFLRMGMNQRYYTAGLEFALERMQFQAATYGEEIGTAAVPRQDRRVMSKFAFRF